MLAAYSGNRQTSQHIQIASYSPAQRRMRTALVIQYAPGLDFAPGVLQGHEPVLARAFLSQPAIVRLHCGIVRRYSRA